MDLDEKYQAYVSNMKILSQAYKVDTLAQF